MINDISSLTICDKVFVNIRISQTKIFLFAHKLNQSK